MHGKAAIVGWERERAARADPHIQLRAELEDLEMVNEALEEAR